jgi:hypothetical protein
MSFIAFGLAVVLSMGGTCRQETAQSVLSTFLTEIAATTGEAIGQSLADRAMP